MLLTTPFGLVLYGRIFPSPSREPLYPPAVVFHLLITLVLHLPHHSDPAPLVQGPFPAIGSI